MIIEQDNIIYELVDTSSSKYAKIVKCLSNKERIIIPNKIIDYNTRDEYTIRSVSDSAFKNCENLVSVVFENPTKITHIGNNAFANCVSLKKFEIPPRIRCISTKCFFNCISLKNISSTSKIIKIENSAFEGCRSLKTISEIVTDDLKKICKNAFKRCYKLSFNGNIDNLQFIGDNAFEKCENVIITGNSLSNQSGFKYEQINSKNKCGWKLSPKMTVPLMIFIIMLLIFSSILALNDFQSWQFSRFIIIGLLFPTIVLLIPPCFAYLKYKKSYFFGALGCFLITVSISLFLIFINLLFSSNENIFKNLSFNKTQVENHYEVLVNPIHNETKIMINDIDENCMAYSASKPNSKENTQNQIFTITENGNELIYVNNYLKTHNINNITIEFVNKYKYIVIETDVENFPLILSENGQEHNLICSEKYKYKFDISNISQFDISTVSNLNNQEIKILLFSFKLNNTVYTLPNKALAIVLFFLFYAILCALILTLLLIIFVFHDIQSLVAENKTFLILLVIITMTIISIICKDSPSEILKNIFSSLTGL